MSADCVTALVAEKAFVYRAQIAKHRVPIDNSDAFEWVGQELIENVESDIAAQHKVDQGRRLALFVHQDCHMAVAWRSNRDISDLIEGQHRHPLVRGITEDMLLYARTQAGLPSLRSRKKNILTVVKKHNFQGDVLPVSSVAAKNSGRRKKCSRHDH